MAETEKQSKLQGCEYVKSQALLLMANPAIITDQQGTICWVNPAFTRITGYTWEEVCGQNPRLFQSGKQTKEYYLLMWNTILAGQIWRGELINRRKDGSLYPEEMTITQVKDPQDRIYFLALKEDMSERRRKEDAAKEVNLMQDYLVARDVELSAVGSLVDRRRTNYTSEFYDEAPLSRDNPVLFQELCQVYGKIVEDALEARIYKVEKKVTPELAHLGERLSRWNSSPRDLVELHSVVIKEKLQMASPLKGRAYLEEGRLLIVELMGYLAAAYRMNCVPLSKG